MCLFNTPKPPKPVTPAAAPAPPEAPPEETAVGSARKAEEDAFFGARGPTYRARQTLGALPPRAVGVRM